MATYSPVYRLTVKAPRSVDATEATTLTPIGGAAHSDPFVVATSASIGGAKPYLHAVDGGTGSIDPAPASKRTTVGSRSITLRDHRTGTGNAQRWVTAFFGDASGKLRLKGCKAILEESLNGGSSWTTIFTGRIGDVRQDGLLKFVLEVKSSAEDLKKKIFVLNPHGSIAYAFRAAFFPPWLPKPWGPVPAGDRIRGTITGQDTPPGHVPMAIVALDQDQDLAVLTMVTKQSYAFSNGGADALFYVTVNGTGATGAFRLPAVNNQSQYIAFPGPNNVARRNYFTSNPNFRYIEELPATHPLYLAMPVGDTAITFYVASAGEDTPISTDSPLFIQDIHPLQLWADILDGKFSIPNADYSARPLAPRDTSAAGPWDYTNPASPSFSMSDLPNVRFIVDDGAKANDWIEKNICQPFNLDYRFDGQGRVVPIDLRVSSSTAVSGAIVDSDLVELPKGWSTDGSQAQLGVNVTYHVDIPKPFENLIDSSDAYPDIAANLIDTTDPSLLVLNPNTVVTRDAGDTITSIDAAGTRLTESEYSSSVGVLQAIDKLSKIRLAQYDALAPFAGGAVVIPLRLRRSSAFATSGREGQFWTITASSVPDPATSGGQRGGARVGLCLSRNERGLAVEATFLDVGSATVAAAPTYSGALGITNGGLNVPITVNAAGDPVQVEYVVTAAGTGARPAATDPNWTIIGNPLTATGSTRLQRLPANTRLWVRIRSRPAGVGLKLPSAYVFPAGGAPAGSIDVAATTAPSVVTVGSITGNRATVSWTNGDATKDVEVFLTTGGVPGTWTELMRVRPTLPPGSTTVELRNLTPSIVNYAVGVRHRDVNGGTSSFATATFSTTGTRTTARLTPPLGIGGGGTTGTGGDVAGLTAQRIAPVGVVLLLNATDPALQFEIQHAPDSAGAPNVGAATTIGSSIPGNRRTFHHPIGLDGTKHWYRHRHIGYGDTAGAWSDWVSALPSVQRTGGPTNSIATPLNAQGRFRCRTRNSANISVVTATLTTITGWDTEDYDVGALHDPGTNPSRITVPVGGDTGVWLIAGSIEWASNATGYRSLTIIKNGVTAIAASVVAAANGLGTVHSVFAFDDNPAAGDRYELQVSQTSGGNLNVIAAQDTYFAVAHVW